MPGKSSIGWTQRTWNPTTGGHCEISKGCDHCYAKEFAERFRGTPGPYEQGFDLKLWPERLNIPKTWPAGTRVFVNSMSDLFQSKVPDDFVDKVFETMRSCPDIIFQVLTKRPKRMAKYLISRGYEPGMIPHVWFGTSIEDRDVVGRADELRKCPVDVRFISAEPLIGPLMPDADHFIDNEHETYPLGDAPVHAWRPWADGYEGPGLDLEGIDWLIIGGESGPGARIMSESWARDLVTHCKFECWQDDWGKDEGRTYVFMKQLGTVLAHQLGAPKKGEDANMFPEDLRIREYPAGLPAEDLLKGPEVTPRLF